MRSVFTLRPAEIHRFWPVFEPFLARVEDRDWTPEGVRAELESGAAQLWGLADEEKIAAILVTKIEVTSSGKRGLLWIAAGKGLEEGLRAMQTHVEPWMKEQGCEYVQIIGRKGWLRVLPDYDEAGVVLVKELR